MTDDDIEQFFAGLHLEAGWEDDEELTSDIDEFLDALISRAELEDHWEDDEAFIFVAQRTWVGWWIFEHADDATVRRVPRRTGAGLSRVYVEKAGPQMRAHP